MEIKENSRTYKILVSICSIVVTAAIGYLIVRAGTIDSPGDPSSAGRMYTLKNIYDYLSSVDSPVPSKPTSWTGPSAEPGPTMHSLDDIFPLLTRFPATGQTTCWDVNGDPTDCSETGHDGDYKKGATLRYKYSDDGTINTEQENVLKDENTGLMWIRDHTLVDSGSGAGGNQDISGTMNWTTALIRCEALEYDDIDGNSQDDWRLPNVKELQSIVNFENYGPAIAITAFPNCQSDYYWSSTSYAKPDYYYAWLVHFNSGYVENSYYKTSNYYVRCVRG